MNIYFYKQIAPMGHGKMWVHGSSLEGNGEAALECYDGLFIPQKINKIPHFFILFLFIYLVFNYL
jgi:hypothetical protein